MQKRVILSIFFILITHLFYSRNLFAENGWINIKSVPNKVNITINKKFIGETPINQFSIEPGKYTIVASKPHYSNKVLTITIPPLTVKNIEIELYRKPDRIGWLNIKSTPDKVKIHINGEDIGETPINQLELPSDNYSLRASKKFYNTRDMTFSIKPFIVKYIEITLKKNKGWKLSENVKSAEIDSGFGMLTILTKEGCEADVFLDSEKIPRKTPLTFEKISAGEHMLELQYKKKRVREKVIINPSEPQVVTISLGIAILTVKTTPENAIITINNAKNFVSSSLSPASFYLKPGNYSLHISKKFFKPINKFVEFTNKSILEEIVLLEETSHMESRIELIKKYLHNRKIYLSKKDKCYNKIDLLQRKIQTLKKSEDLDSKIIQKDLYYQKSFAPGIFSAIVAPISILVYFMSDSTIKNPKHINFLKKIGVTVYTTNQFVINDNTPIEEQFESFSNNYNYLIGLLQYELIQYDQTLTAQKPQDMIDKQNALINKKNKEIYNEINKIKKNSGILEIQNKLNNNIEHICQNLAEIGEPCDKTVGISDYDYFEKIFTSMLHNHSLK